MTPAPPIIHTGPAINISGSVSREDIVKKVINIFVDFEKDKRGRGIKFLYPVEDIIGLDLTLYPDSKLYLRRPGGLQKWNMDFKVLVESHYGLQTGRHDNLKEDFSNKKKENPKSFKKVLDVLNEFYECRESDIDKILSTDPELENNFNTGAKLNIILKCIKWMFIMEDIVYWNYDGRAKLYNHLLDI